ncbi:MAG: VWA domain-containing protein [Planctomycetaceae bacterium]|nr:VWA domain-containing protein [Planctomycetaceae bacterium]
MSNFSSDTKALVMSFAVHGVILTIMALAKFTLLDNNRDVLVETVFSDEREQQEFTQELDINTEVSENLSIVAGATVSTNNGGSSAPAVSQTKIETSESLNEPEIQVNVAQVSLPGANQLGQDLGEAEIKGETGAVVEGYGAAMSRLTQELIRLMRQDKVHVVWLFDESESMKDEQKEIRDQFHKVYEELKIAQESDEKLKTKDADHTLLTTILSYGAGINTHTEKPTPDIPEIQKAIDKIPIDTTGEENLFQSIMAVCDKYGPLAIRAQRKLAIVVLSDEAGDDGTAVEEAISRVKRYKAPVYIMGREAIFGYPYARMRWTDPKFGLDFWIDVRRGPETAFPEALQYDGLHRRWDSFSSGFGCYEQVRLARESGGIYFMLPGDEETLAGRAAHLERKFEFLAMKEYQPLLMARREYEQERNKSEFRKEIWNIITVLNPYQDENLNIQEHWYAFSPEDFRPQGMENASRALRAFGILNEAIRRLEAIKDQRAREDSQRWRAAYDLCYAQCLSFRVRLFQFMLAVDSHLKSPPKPKVPNANRWNVVRIRDMKEPDEEQIRRTKVDMDELNAQLDKAKKEYEFVKAQHPGTPWDQRANWELNSGFGFEFRDVFRDPRYDTMRDQIKVPSL